MAKLVIGNNKTVGVPAITKKVEELPALGLMRAKDANGKLIASTTESQIIDFTGVTDIDEYMLAYAYYNNTAISGTVDMSDLTTLTSSDSCSKAFYGCMNITGADLSSLTTISGSYACSYMFNNCTSLTILDLSSLTTISGNYGCQYMFYNCSGLTSVDLSSLTTVSGTNSCYGMFQGCTSLTSVDLSGLTSVTSRYCFSYLFNSCTSLTTVRFGNTAAISFGSTYTNQFNNMFNNCIQNIDVYAPAASKSAIEALTGYPNFSGTGTVTWHWNTAE